jgi:hypothetical protein
MLKATIKIRHREARMSDSVARSLKPDNILAPPGVRVETRARGEITITTITCAKSLETFIATIDDLLLCMDAAERVLGEIEAERRV